MSITFVTALHPYDDAYLMAEVAVQQEVAAHGRAAVISFLSWDAGERHVPSLNVAEAMDQRDAGTLVVPASGAWELHLDPGFIDVFLPKYGADLKAFVDVVSAQMPVIVTAPVLHVRHIEMIAPDELVVLWGPERPSAQERDRAWAYYPDALTAQWPDESTWRQALEAYHARDPSELPVPPPLTPARDLPLEDAGDPIAYRCASCGHVGAA